LVLTSQEYKHKDQDYKTIENLLKKLYKKTMFINTGKVITSIRGVKYEVHISPLHKTIANNKHLHTWRELEYYYTNYSSNEIFRMIEENKFPTRMLTKGNNKIRLEFDEFESVPYPEEVIDIILKDYKNFKKTI